MQNKDFDEIYNAASFISYELADDTQLKDAYNLCMHAARKEGKCIVDDFDLRFIRAAIRHAMERLAICNKEAKTILSEIQRLENR